jgi:hypothetical protein
MQERRKLHRFKLKLPARIEISPQDFKGKTEVLRLETNNICSGGAFFHTLSLLPEGTPVDIDFILDIKKLTRATEKRPLINVRGHVLRTEPTGMAVQFSNDFRILTQAST